MARVRPPTAAHDPAFDLVRHRLDRMGVATPAYVRRDLDETLQASPSTPHVRPILAGSWSDGTAGRALARILHDLGYIDNKSEA